MRLRTLVASLMLALGLTLVMPAVMAEAMECVPVVHYCPGRTCITDPCIGLEP